MRKGGRSAGLRAEDEAVLTVSVTNTFANTWLAWRLGGFHLAHPSTAVRLWTSNALADFAADEVDVAIRSGPGGWAGLAQHELLPLDFTFEDVEAMFRAIGAPEGQAEGWQVRMAEQGMIKPIDRPKKTRKKPARD